MIINKSGWLGLALMALATGATAGRDTIKYEYREYDLPVEIVTKYSNCSRESALTSYGWAVNIRLNDACKETGYPYVLKEETDLGDPQCSDRAIHCSWGCKGVARGQCYRYRRN